jgi:hypothetical protein
MTKLTMILALCLIGASLSAQTGLFDLRFAMPLSEADSLLQSKGFEASGDSLSHRAYQIPGHMYLRAIYLVPDLNAEILAGWVVCYDTLQAGAELIEQMTVGSLITFHDAGFDRDGDRFVWDLSEYRWVVAYFDATREHYLVEYHDSDAATWEYY